MLNIRRLFNQFLVINLSSWLVILLGIGISTTSLFVADVNETDAAATGVAYSNDPNTGHFQTWGANVVIWFNDPVGTSFRICNGGCTGFAVSYVNPQQYGGFNWIFQNAGDGNVLEAQSERGGNASCTMQIRNGYRYCGVGIPDRDGDGVPDIADACPDQGNQGHGVDGSGCPNPPPPPTPTPIPPTPVPTLPPPPPPPPPVSNPDRDGDGVPDDRDSCPDRGNEGYGVDASGCPYPPPTPIPDTTDRCPEQPGIQPNGCIITPVCHVSFLVPVVYLRSGPSVEYEIVGNRSSGDRPILAIAKTTNNQGELWYRLQSSTPLYVIANPAWVQLGQPCNTLPNDGETPTTIIIEVDTDGDGVPNNRDVCLDRGDEGFGIDETGCPRQPLASELVPVIRELSPYRVLDILGCPIQTGEAISNASRFIWMTIIEAPDPCAAKEEYNLRLQVVTPIEVARGFFTNTPERQHFFDKLLTCDTLILEQIMQFITNNDRREMLGRFIEQIIGDQDPCALILSWRTEPDIPLPIPPDSDPEEGIHLGVMLCSSNPNLSQKRYDQLVSRLYSVWGLSIDEMTCEDINSANRIGTPSIDQQILFGRLRECKAEIHKPIWALEKLIMKNNDNPKWFDLSCAELHELVNCEDCSDRFALPDELALCVLNVEDYDLMTLFTKNHAPQEQDTTEGRLTASELLMIYSDINPCDAVIEYLNTGVIRQPIILPPSIPDTPPIETTPEIAATPIPNGGNTDPTASETPENIEIPNDILIGLGFDKPRAASVVLDTVGIIYVSNNNIYIQENGNTPKIFDDIIEGEKYSPIIFNVNNRRILAYILVHEGEARIRIINLSTNDAVFARMSELVKPHHLSPLAYSGSLLVFTGIDPNGQFNLYGIPFSRKEQTDTARLLIHNAKNASAIEGFAGFVFEQPDATNNILLWIPGRQGQDLYPIDEGIDSTCSNPVGERFGNKWRFWFLCDNADGELVLYTHNMQDQYATPNNINLDLAQQGASGIQQLSLGELQGELFLGDGESIFHYHQRQKNPKVERFLVGATTIFIFSRE